MPSRPSLLLLLALAAGCGEERAQRALPAPDRSGPVGEPHEERPSAPDPALCTRRQVEIEGRPEGLLAGDFDGDGKRDLVATTFAPGAVHCWRGKGAGLRPADAVIAVGDYPLQPVAWEQAEPAPASSGNGGPGNIGSGARAPLLAVASRADRTLRLLDLRSSTVVRSIDLPATPRALAAGDVDGDGTAELVIAVDGRRLLVVRAAGPIEERPLASDLPRCLCVLRGARAVAVGSQDTQAVEVLSWSGEAGAAPLGGVLTLKGIPRALVEADLDGDGDLELAVAGGERSTWIFGLGTGGGARTWMEGDADPPLELDVGTVPIALLASDFDADGKEDLLALAHHGVRWSIWSGFDPARARLSQQAYAGQTPCSAALADLDGDGRLDLATANRDSRAISVFAGRPEGSSGARFAAPVGISVGSFPVAVSAIDLDGEGALEIAAVLAKDAALSIVGSARTGNGAVERARVPLGSSPRALACGDLDGDGREEAAAIVRDATSSRIVALSLEPSGQVKWRLEARLGRGGGDLIYLPKSGDRPPSLLAADPDGDEIVWIQARGQSASDLRLAESARIALPSGPRAIASVRVGDAGEAAIAVALGGPGPRTGLALLRWKEDGLEEWRFFPSAGAHRDVAAGDLNGDGREDLVLLSLETADGAAGWITPWFQAPSDGGGPAFTPGARSRTTARAQALAVSDIDGDGLAEVLCACLESHVVDAWKSRPSEPGGPFELFRLPGVGAGLGCTDVRVADVDGDGRLEILVAGSANDEVSVIFPLDR